MLSIHDLQLLDIGQGKVRHPPLRLAKHRFGKIYPDYAVLRGVARERNASADANFENPATDLLRCGDRLPPPAIEHGAKDQIVDGSPARIRLLQSDPVQFCRRFLLNCIRHQTPPQPRLDFVIKPSWLLLQDSEETIAIGWRRILSSLVVLVG